MAGVLNNNALTLGGYSLNESTLKYLNRFYYIPDNFAVGDTVILDGIECVVIAKSITIQNSSYTNIAIDKNHDLGWYQKYMGTTWDNRAKSQYVTEANPWIWGGYGTSMGGTSSAVGYGLKNTVKYLYTIVNGTNGTGENYTWFPSLYRGLTDFRSAHGDSWFLPSLSELVLVKNISSRLGFADGSDIGATSANDWWWSSTEYNSGYVYRANFSSGSTGKQDKWGAGCARLCRAF